MKSRYGGVAFSDQKLYFEYGPITMIKMWTGEYVDAIEVRYGDTDQGLSKKHGGDGGGLFTYNLNKGAKILFVLGRTGFLVDELGFVTDDAYVFGPHGGAGGGPFVSRVFSRVLRRQCLRI